MKKIVSLILIFCSISFICNAQKNGMVAYFDVNKQVIVQTDNYTQTDFGLKATPGQLEEISKMVSPYSKVFTFKSEVATGQAYSYQCSLVFLHGEDINSLHKTLLSLGIELFEYDKKQYDINKMFEILKK